jgi:hypothetical protein
MRRTGIAAATAFVASIALVGTNAAEAAAATPVSAISTTTKTVTPTQLYCASVFEALQPFAKASLALGSANTSSVSALYTVLHGWSAKASSGAKKALAVSAPKGTSKTVRNDVAKLARVMHTAAAQTKTIHTVAQLTSFDSTGTTMDKDITALSKACGV